MQLSDNQYVPQTFNCLATTDSRGVTTYRDELARKTGTSETNSRGETVYRDALGRKTGTSTTNSRGETTYRDALGRKQSTLYFSAKLDLYAMPRILVYIINSEK